jgi:hypothetical protein
VTQNRRRPTRTLNSKDSLQPRCAPPPNDDDRVGATSNLISNHWSLDGRHIVYTNTAVTSGFNLWVWPISGEREPLRVVETPLNAMHGRFIDVVARRAKVLIAACEA